MTFRIVTIAICVCVVGSSVVPAGILPCCCKAKAADGNGAFGSGSCCAPRTAAPLLDTYKAVNSCCGGQVSRIQTCPSQSSFSPICPACRCLEQMKLVSLTSSATTEEASRTSQVAALLVDTLCFQVELRSQKAVSGAVLSSNLPIILQNCSLRI